MKEPKLEFWKHKCLGHTTLRDQYPILYNIGRKIHETIIMVQPNNPPNISFRRNLVGPNLIAWQNLIDRLTNVQLR
jgi:hypothetical protein